MIKPWPKPSRITKRNDHPFLSLIAPEILVVVLNVASSGANHTRTSQQIRNVALWCVVNLPGNEGREAQTCFGSLALSAFRTASS